MVLRAAHDEFVVGRRLAVRVCVVDRAADVGFVVGVVALVVVGVKSGEGGEDGGFMAGGVGGVGGAVGEDGVSGLEGVFAADVKAGCGHFEAVEFVVVVNIAT